MDDNDEREEKGNVAEDDGVEKRDQVSEEIRCCKNLAKKFRLRKQNLYNIFLL